MLALVKKGRVKDRNGNVKRRGELADLTDSQADFYAHRIEINEKQRAPKQDASLPEDFPLRDRLIKAGFGSVDKIAMTDDETLLSVNGLGEATLEKIRNGYNSD